MTWPPMAFRAMLPIRNHGWKLCDESASFYASSQEAGRFHVLVSVGSVAKKQKMVDDEGYPVLVWM